MEKIIFNQKYIISFYLVNIRIYENKKPKKFLDLSFDEVITDIQFNPILDNIILVSFFKGYCKIYKIEEQKLLEKITFEGINNQIIGTSKFNYLNTNIIASLSNYKTIIIWDIRELIYINVININEKEKEVIKKKKIEEIEEIDIINWNKIFKDSLEIKTENQIKLINIRSGKEIRSLKNNNKIVNVLFLEDYNIIVNINIIEKANIRNNSSKYLECKKILESNDNFIKDNILIIIRSNDLMLINLTKMEIIKSVNLEFPIKQYSFYHSDEDKDILFYYYQIKALNIQSIELNCKISKISDYSDLSNIKNDFYDKYQKKIYKYICFLHFKENIIEEINCKKYMNIEEINEFFNKIKIIDIFSRKDFVNYIFGDKTVSINKFNNIIKVSNFKEIIEYSKLFEIKITEQRKSNMINKIKVNFCNDNKKINNFYIQIIKLLILDNTNEKLVEIYLIFLSLYINILKNNFSEQKIEEYDSEVKNFYPCFSKTDYKTLFGLDKESEKDIVFNFLMEAYKIKSYNIDNNIGLKSLIAKAKSLLINIPDFNQPIELDSQNEELKWYKIKINILTAFNGFKLISEEQDALDRLKTGIQTIMFNKFLENNNIFNDKDKLECALILIINPCDVSSKDFQFCSNLLLSENLSEEKSSQLKKIYKDAEYICLNNLSRKFDKYDKDEKYNFKYLIDNYVSNQNEIKSFLKNILIKNVFKEAYKILFGNEEYKLLNDRYLEEFIDKRLKFAPIRPYGSAALSDKMSLNTYIVAKKRIIQNIKSEEIELILNTGCYVLIEEHEIFHILDCLPYYENNCSKPIKTPGKKNYNGEAEGGIYLEYLLFNKILNKLNLKEILYLLNEKNYDKSLIDFREGFEKLDKEDLKIVGIFSKYNEFKDLKEIEPSKLTKPVIYIKSSMEDIPYTIEIELKNCVIGNRPFI